ncbi:unnamed protein product [Blepharisma stoltei]|uniref:type I protein arginine methyltransferase n=1 Tax=Blepharisma stoltei TaxID=1481888 RepID=A0AAU9KHU7_9CILI|nr:unnamed protein product [Blepharisma stoltei]
MEFTTSNETEFSNETLWSGLQENNTDSNGDYYFDSYDHFTVHEGMLKDNVRTDAYKKAILRNPYLFEDKIVLDIGCGTGILSFFAVQAGAKHVYAVDNSEIAEQAIKIVAKNSLNDKITVLKGKIEEIELPVSSVDIIISEWMGIFLLYEGMINSIIFARDKWLSKNGLLFPDKAKIWVAGLEDASCKDERIEFWNDIYGIDMSPMRKIAIKEPSIDVVEATNLVSTSTPVFEVDLQKCNLEQLSFISTFRLQFTRKDFMHAIVGWFEVIFTHCHKAITLTTSPKCEATHWKHTIFYLEESIPVDVGEILNGAIAVRFSLRFERGLDIKISVNKEGKMPIHSFQYYRLR